MTKTIKLSTETLAALAEAMGDQINPKIIDVESEATPMLGKVCVIRTYSAGVHIGTVEAKSGTNVLLSNAVRLYKWSGAFTLSEVASAGVGTGSRISAEVPLIELSQAVEIIPTSEGARATFSPRNGA